MRPLRAVFLLTAIPLAMLFAQPAEGPDALEQVKRMGRGVNIIGYDPIWKDPAKARFQEKHFAKLHEAGFQTVRVNLHAFAHMDSDHRLSAQWFKTTDWVVEKALANHLMVILDEHDFQFCGKQPAACRTRLMAFWEQVADRYKDSPPEVVFEILNEPNGLITDKDWNEISKEALAIIRKTNPTRDVIVGPAFWNNIGHLKQLELPEQDRHIIATVHYYLPMNFTHQGAPWNPETAKLSGIPWGTDAEKKRMESDFAGVQEWSKSQRRPILLGEFGAYDKAQMNYRVAYTAYAARTAESLGWAWTYWQFDSDFILWDMSKDAWVQPILKALVP